MSTAWLSKDDSYHYIYIALENQWLLYFIEATYVNST